MTPRSASITALLAAAALALAGCSASGESTPPPSGDAAPSSAPATEPSSPASSGDEAGMALIGMVGTADDPDAYEIALTDADGQPVETLAAGDYTLTFADRTAAHNFRLTGPGGVDVATDVAGTDETSVQVTLVAGTYTFVCDPHPATMVGEVEVTG